MLKNENKEQAPAQAPQQPPMTVDQAIDARQFQIMQRQISDLTTALARAEATRDVVLAENQALGAELQTLQAKGKKK